MIVETTSLKLIPLFAELGADELEAVKQALFEKSVRRGEMIFLEGEAAENLYVLISGAVKVFKTSAQGKEQIISIALPNEVLNDITIFDQNPNPLSAQTMTPVVLYGIKKDVLEEIIRKYPSVSLNILKKLSERTRQLLYLIEDLSFKHVIGRVGKILLEFGGDGSGPNPRLTQQEMAAMAGTAREVVARSLKKLEDRGVIKFDRHRIIITNKEALTEMVRESV